MKDKMSVICFIKHVVAGKTIYIETIPWLPVSLQNCYLSYLSLIYLLSLVLETNEI